MSKLKEFYLIWVEITKIVPSNRLEQQRGELLTQKLLELSKEIDKELKNNENSTKISQGTNTLHQ
jgi:hypothetical protein